MKRHPLVELFITFFKIGAFTFGGGYAMIPMVQHEIVDRHGYITEDEFMDIIAIAEATPGVIAVNTATFVGYKIHGVLGGIIATLGVVIPSFVIITIISGIYEAFRENTWVAAAFSGIRAGVVVLIISAMMRLGKHNDKNAFVLGLTALAFVLTSFTTINVAWLIVIGAVAGLLRQVIVLKMKGDDA